MTTDELTRSAQTVDRLLTAPAGQRAAYLDGWRDGYMTGENVGRQRGWAAADAHADLLHRGAVDVARRAASPQAMAHSDREERRRRHQEDAAAQRQAKARPWPEETVPPHPHALFVVLTTAEKTQLEVAPRQGRRAGAA